MKHYFFTNDKRLLFHRNSETHAIQMGGCAQIVLISELRPLTKEDQEYFDNKERARRESFGGKSYDSLVGCLNGTKANDKHIHIG